MDNVILREATINDCERLMDLVHQLAVYEKAPEQVTVTLDHFKESGFGPAPVWWAIVTEVNGVIQGFALYYIRYSTWKGQRMYLEDFIVNEEERGKGLGKMLFDRLIEIAKEKKLSGMVWQVLDWNEPAINFYKKYKEVTFESGWLNSYYNFS